jgi:hypothetical protein
MSGKGKGGWVTKGEKAEKSDEETNKKALESLSIRGGDKE